MVKTCVLCVCVKFFYNIQVYLCINIVTYPPNTYKARQSEADVLEEDRASLIRKLSNDPPEQTDGPYWVHGYDRDL